MSTTTNMIALSLLLIATALFLVMFIRRYLAYQHKYEVMYQFSLRLCRETLVRTAGEESRKSTYQYCRYNPPECIFASVAVGIEDPVSRMEFIKEMDEVVKL